MKKETTLSILREIRDLLKNKTAGIDSKQSASASTIPPKEEFILFDFPEITAKEIIEKANNKTSKNTPILYSIDWYKNEPFYMTEKTRKGKRWVKITPSFMGKSWDECKDLMATEGGEMLNFAELLYVFVEHEKTTGINILKNNYSWVSSISSGCPVSFGSAGAEGAYVSRGGPDCAWYLVGAVFSRIES